MASSPEFRVDVIFHSLKELQHEKQLLEARLQEQKEKLQEVEALLEAADSRYRQCSERHVKMVETVHVAKEKVLQSENQAKRLNELNGNKQQKVQELNRRIKEVEAMEDEEYKSFEERLEGLTDKIRSAKTYYTTENLESEIQHWSTTRDETDKKAEAHQMSMKEMTNALEGIEREEEQLKDKMLEGLEFGLTCQDLQNAKSVFMELKAESASQLENQQRQLEDQKKRLEEIKGNSLPPNVDPTQDSEEMEPAITMEQHSLTDDDGQRPQGFNMNSDQGHSMGQEAKTYRVTSAEQDTTRRVNDRQFFLSLPMFNSTK
ncbi:synaptonemal complex central element protein 1 [Nematostella vectensis]|uniref:synaptonemal complex central element protein 1 n=1 Tax=Nematostella vectensis TaxID=45351 RepID=UPI002076D88E|nr:synaptonemal complex central element protein 1 [Nematostella vectensis]